MKRRIMLTIVLGLLITISGCQKNKQEEMLKTEAARIHKNVLVIDTHTDTPLRLMREDFDLSVWHDPRASRSKLDLPRMAEGGLDAVFFAAFVGQGPRDLEGHEKVKEKALKIIDTIHRHVGINKDAAALALNPGDAYRLEDENKRAIYIGIENGYAVGNDLALLEKFYALGVRYITLCHTKNNNICDSSTDPDGAEFNGLSALGDKVVDEMNRLGMIVDVSHISDAAFYDVLAKSAAPVMASHSCARALCDNPRNLDDDMLRALAAKGGVIQMCVFSDYVKTPKPNVQRDSAVAVLRATYSNYINSSDQEKGKIHQMWEEVDSKYPKELATVVDVVDHIDHIVKVAGIEHVGIGTDFDGGGGVDGCYDVSEMGNITLELVRRGYTEEQIQKIWGGNFMRVFKAVEAYAQKQQQKQG